MKEILIIVIIVIVIGVPLLELISMIHSLIKQFMMKIKLRSNRVKPMVEAKGSNGSFEGKKTTINKKPII